MTSPSALSAAVSASGEPEPLLPRVAAGDRTAADECIRRYGSIVWSIARRMSPTRADAEDAAQEIFMQLWSVAGKFDARKSPEGAFIALVSRRRMIDRLRTQNLKRAAEVELESPLVSTVAAPDLPAADRIDLELAAALLSELPEDRQQVIALSLVYGYSHGQIAERTGVPLGTVKSIVRRSLLSIRQRLGLRADGALSAGSAP